jgi:hypothetical protein
MHSRGIQLISASATGRLTGFSYMWLIFEPEPGLRIKPLRSVYRFQLAPLDLVAEMQPLRDEILEDSAAIVITEATNVVRHPPHHSATARS